MDSGWRPLLRIPVKAMAMEGRMRRTIDKLLPALVLVRIGQELGTDSPAARALHDLLELLAALPWKLLG